MVHALHAGKQHFPHLVYVAAVSRGNLHTDPHFLVRTTCFIHDLGIRDDGIRYGHFDIIPGQKPC